ncbi:hypothetical protein JHK86_037452 [Glycine max]|nr:hypothetical protein JHK86_037452 [Glycine max]
MRRFLVDRASIENVNVVQQEAELEPPPNVVNEFNPNEIVRDPVPLPVISTSRISLDAPSNMNHGEL